VSDGKMDLEVVPSTRQPVGETTEGQIYETGGIFSNPVVGWAPSSEKAYTR
jgi:hypothetical protein